MNKSSYFPYKSKTKKFRTARMIAPSMHPIFMQQFLSLQQQNIDIGFNENGNKQSSIIESNYTTYEQQKYNANNVANQKFQKNDQKSLNETKKNEASNVNLEFNFANKLSEDELEKILESRIPSVFNIVGRGGLPSILYIDGNIVIQ